MIASHFFLVFFQLPCALAPNVWTIFVGRFLQGLLGAAPACNTGGTIHDMFSREENGGPLIFHTISSITSPGLAMVVSGYIIQEMGWKWVCWVMMAILGGFWLAILLTIPETRHSVSCPNQARKPYPEAWNDNYITDHPSKQSKTRQTDLTKGRPKPRNHRRSSRSTNQSLNPP
jgi:MFS family permease